MVSNSLPSWHDRANDTSKETMWATEIWGNWQEHSKWLPGTLIPSHLANIKLKNYWEN